MTPVEKENDAAGLAMTELDERLRSPEGKALASTILFRFNDLMKDLEESKTQGLTPDKFAATETLLKAVADAAATVIAFTKFHHATSDDGVSGMKRDKIH